MTVRPRYRTPEEALADLKVCAEQLAEHTASSERLYRERDALFVTLREGFDRPVTQREIAAAAAIQEGALVAALRKIGQRRGVKVR